MKLFSSSLTMEVYRLQYNRLRDQLMEEMYSFGRVLDGIPAEDMTNESFNTMLVHVNESTQKLVAQVQVYSAFFELKNNLKRMADGIPTCLG